ncbi:MAG: hypothetical protein AAF458_02790 [Pseudomonadota bacterium]
MTEERSDKLDPQSDAVCAYLAALQGVVTRMAGNSASCKNWCITLVAGVLVIVLDKGKPEYGLISLVPVFVFAYLDAFYLRLERQYRAVYDTFVRLLNAGEGNSQDLHVLNLGALSFKDKLRPISTLDAAVSTAVWPYYTVIAAAVVGAVRLAP